MRKRPMIFEVFGKSAKPVNDVHVGKHGCERHEDSRAISQTLTKASFGNQGSRYAMRDRIHNLFLMQSSLSAEIAEPFFFAFSALECSTVCNHIKNRYHYLQILWTCIFVFLPPGNPSG